MKTVATRASPGDLYLDNLTAADMMTTNPVSVRTDASIAEAIDLLTRRGISAAPVIDEAGRPVGVLSRGDVLVHDREEVVHATPTPPRKKGHPPEERVRDIMTPVLFCVAPEVPANHVVHELLRLKIHRLFVVDTTGILLGVISAMDILRHLRRCQSVESSR